jgi:hypothetical protein
MIHTQLFATASDHACNSLILPRFRCIRSVTQDILQADGKMLHIWMQTRMHTVGLSRQGNRATISNQVGMG